MLELDLQKAVYLALNGNVSADVYDHVPQKSPYPYVVIGEDVFNDWSTDTKDGMESVLNIHVWHRVENDSGKQGREVTKQIQGEIYSILHRSAFDVGDYGNPGMTFEYSDCLLDPDGLTYHGVQRFRVNIAQKDEFILGT